MNANTPQPNGPEPGLADSEDLFNFDEVVAAKLPPPAAEPKIDVDALIRAIDEQTQPHGERPALAAAGASASAGLGAQPRRGAGTVPAREAAATPALAAQLAPVYASAGLGRTAWIALAGLALLCVANSALVLFTWSSQKQVGDGLSEMSQAVVQATQQLAQESDRQAQVVSSIARPVVAPSPERRDVLAQAEADIAAGQHDLARQRIYALLAVRDRFEPNEREELEARSRYLLAEALGSRALAAGTPQRGGAR